MFNILVNNSISITHSIIGIVPGQESPEAIGQNGYISLLLNVCQNVSRVHRPYLLLVKKNPLNRQGMHVTIHGKQTFPAAT
jgi:hypothetical protein